jgi:hypothetical protein
MDMRVGIIPPHGFMDEKVRLYASFILAAGIDRKRKSHEKY